jgi:sugar lactone lactonase YvrE
MDNHLKIIIIACCTFLVSETAAQTGSLQEYFKLSQTAYKEKNYAGFYDNILQAHKLHPYHQGILYQAGIASTLNRKTSEAITFLNKAIQINAGYDLDIPDLQSLAELPEFLKLKALQATLLKPTVQSDTAFVVKDKSLHVECIASGETDNTFYLGSIHKRKILKIENGVVHDFTSPEQDGLTAVFGIKVDKQKNNLWACASPVPEMQNFDSSARSGVFKYDIHTGKLLHKYAVPTDINNSVFGDLVLGADGKVYVSDSKNNIIFFVNEITNKLEVFYKADEFWNIQGITFSADQRELFIADYVKGLYKLDLSSKTLSKVEPNFEASIKGIDGLAYHKKGLIAVQNGIFPMRVTKYYLDANGKELSSYQVIDAVHPAFNEPTIGCVSKETYYYIANSQWSGYTADHKLKPEDQLQDTIILSVDLSSVK